MRDIPGFEGLYSVTSCGKVWSCRSKKFLKPYKRGRGYWTIDLLKDGQRCKRSIHRLVALAYIPNPDPEHLNQVGHDDDNKDHNYVSNLYWTDNQENNSREAKLRSISKRVKCVETGEVYASMHKADEALGCSSGQVSRVIDYPTRSIYGFHFVSVESE